jgi:hypothetical protein
MAGRVVVKAWVQSAVGMVEMGDARRFAHHLDHVQSP